MKKYLKALILILIALAILIPLASNAPDGLERVAETLQIEEHEPLWEGLMPDYSLPIIENAYLSTLLAGILGVFLVLAIGFLLGTSIGKPESKP